MSSHPEPVRNLRKPRSGLRRFLIATGILAGGGLAVGASLAGWRAWQITRYRFPAGSGAHAFNAWISVDRQGLVSVAVPHQEMGQGIHSLVALLVAEEMDCDPGRVLAVPAPLVAAYSNPFPLLDALRLNGDDDRLGSTANSLIETILRLGGEQLTGGSSSVRNCWEAARRAAAAARAMLIGAAARRWEVPAERLRCIQSRVVDPAGNRYAGFGELAEEASLLKPQAVRPKPRDQYRLLGRGIARQDSRPKSDGSLRYALDVRLPGMVFASVRHAPQIGSMLRQAVWPGGAAPEGAVLIKGEDWFAVTGSSWWVADRIADSVQSQWSDPPDSRLSTESMAATLRQRLDGDTLREVVRRGGTPERVSPPGRSLEARYETPLLAHQTMEPMNCTVRLRADSCEVWVGTQVPGLVQRAVARVVGLPREQVLMNLHPMGCGLGRRLELDVVRQAAVIALALPRGQPVQLMWRRDEDTRRDMFRPAAAARLQATLGARGELASLDCTLAGTSALAQYARRLTGFGPKWMPDRSVHDGVSDCPYDIDTLSIRWAQVESDVPVGFWRSVGYGTNAFFIESFIDECAHLAGDDPYQYRRRLLSRQARHLRVLEEVARLSNWGRPVPARRGTRTGRGIALTACYGSILALVIEIEVEGSEVRVQRAIAAVDCGIALDRSSVRAQIAGGIVMGLSAALHGQIDVKGARVQQSNFREARLLLMKESPRIQVETLDGDAHPGGVGELGVPAVAPALANAVFSATGKRIRRLPLRFS